MQSSTDNSEDRKNINQGQGATFYNTQASSGEVKPHVIALQKSHSQPEKLQSDHKCSASAYKNH